MAAGVDGLSAYAAIVTAFLVVGTAVTIWAVVLGRASSRPMPTPEPTFPEPPYGDDLAWQRLLMAVEGTHPATAAHIAKHEAAAFDPDAVDWNERSGA